MKKFLCALIACALLISGLIIPVSAAGEYEIIDGVLTAYKGASAMVTVPDGVRVIGDSAFEGNSTVIRVTLPDSVYSIGNRAFYDCTSLQTLNNTQNITNIGAYAFTNTALVNFAETDLVSINNIIISARTQLETAAIPAGTSAIAPYAFAGNTALRSVTIPQSLTTIGEGAFYNCTALAEISVPQTVSSVGPLAFVGTAWLESKPSEFVTVGDGILIACKSSSAIISIPSGVKQIGGGAFYKNDTVREIIVADGCFVIQIRAFAECPKLERVYLPSSIVGIDPLAFENSPLVTISAESGSFAERFAEAHSIPHNNSETPVIIGDVDGNGMINSSDATLVLQHYAGIITLSGKALTAANVDDNPDVNSIDATLILQRYAGIIDEFGMRN